MARIKVHAGDFLEGKGQISGGAMVLRTEEKSWIGEAIPFTSFEELETASEDSVKRIGGTIGWGAAGALVLGPVGLLAGLLVGGRGKDVTFVGKLKDGRKILATTDSKTFTKMMAANF